MKKQKCKQLLLLIIKKIKDPCGKCRPVANKLSQTHLISDIPELLELILKTQQDCVVIYVIK